jgi:hypothetical protein
MDKQICNVDSESNDISCFVEENKCVSSCNQYHIPGNNNNNRGSKFKNDDIRNICHRKSCSDIPIPENYASLDEILIDWCYLEKFTEYDIDFIIVTILLLLFYYYFIILLLFVIIVTTTITNSDKYHYVEACSPSLALYNGVCVSSCELTFTKTIEKSDSSKICKAKDCEYVKYDKSRKLPNGFFFFKFSVL